MQVRGSRETLGKGSLCEKAALAIANQVEHYMYITNHLIFDLVKSCFACFVAKVSVGESVQCLEIPGSLKEVCV